MAPCVWARWRTPFREEVGWFFRLLFLAVAEARRVEPVGQLARLARSMDRLAEVCQRVAGRFHSPLFVKPSPPIDEAGTRRVLEEMAAWLAQGPVVPADLLTTAYEAVLVDVPERKRSGAYYTPPPLADAVLKQVLPSEPGVTPPLILDPACGAGVFLNRAFVALQPHFAGDDILQALHGVDLDPLAIEIARLGLLLRVAEGRGLDTELPDLSANLRCANALLGPISVAECSRSGEPSRTKGHAPGSWSSVVMAGAARLAAPTANPHGRSPWACDFNPNKCLTAALGFRQPAAQPPQSLELLEIARFGARPGFVSPRAVA